MAGVGRFEFLFREENSGEVTDDKSPTYPGYLFDIILSPGTVTTSSVTILLGNILTVLQGLNDWVDTIQEELQAEPIFRKVSDLQSRIEELSSQLEDFEDEYATAEQVSDIESRLNEMEVEFRERIQKLEQDDEEKQKRLAEFGETIEYLKQRAQDRKIKEFLRILGSRSLSD